MKWTYPQVGQPNLLRIQSQNDVEIQPSKKDQCCIFLVHNRSEKVAHIDLRLCFLPVNDSLVCKYAIHLACLIVNQDVMN